MIILFSPTKDMDFSNPLDLNHINLENESKKILSEICKLEDSEFHKIFKLNENLLNEVKMFYRDFNDNSAFYAIDLYNGLSFRQIDKEFLKSNKNFLNKNILILSSLYGPIKMSTKIKPYRLDMNTRIKVNNLSLKNFWKEKYNSYLNEGDLVINLASNEFSSIIEKENYDFWDIDFYKKKNGILKAHSTTSKKGRGMLLNSIVRYNIESIDELKKININNLKLIEAKKQKLIYLLED